MWALWLPYSGSVLHLARNAGPALYDPLCGQLGQAKVNLRDTGPEGMPARELPRYQSDWQPGRWLWWNHLSCIAETDWRPVCENCLERWERGWRYERDNLAAYLDSIDQQHQLPA